MSLIFNTRFEAGSLSVFNDPDSYNPPSQNHLIAGRGINHSYALTCSVAGVGQNVVAFATPLQDLRCCVMEQFYTNNPGAVLWPKDIASFDELIAFNSVYARAFNAFITAYQDGHIRVSIVIGNTGAGSITFTADSAAGVIAYNGSVHAIEYSFHFVDYQTCDVDIAVNGSIVISDTASCSGVGIFTDFWSQSAINLNIGGINWVYLNTHSATYGSVAFQNSIGEILIYNDSGILGYDPLFMPTLSSVTCPDALPSEEQGSGLYVLTNVNKHDTIYENPAVETKLYKKIPDPFVITNLIGDE